MALEAGCVTPDDEGCGSGGLTSGVPVCDGATGVGIDIATTAGMAGDPAGVVKLPDKADTCVMFAPSATFDDAGQTDADGHGSESVLRGVPGPGGVVSTTSAVSSSRVLS